MSCWTEAVMAQTQPASGRHAQVCVQVRVSLKKKYSVLDWQFPLKKKRKGSHIHFFVNLQNYWKARRYVRIQFPLRYTETNSGTNAARTLLWTELRKQKIKFVIKLRITQWTKPALMILTCSVADSLVPGSKWSVKLKYLLHQHSDL